MYKTAVNCGITHQKRQISVEVILRSTDFHRPNTFAVRFSLVQFGSLWFNLASVDIINFENKYDYPDNYELQQHRRSSVAVQLYKMYITTASSTVLLGITRACT